MSLDVVREILVHRPRPDVAAYLFDPARDPDWIGGVRQCEVLEGQGGPGTRVRRTLGWLGRTFHLEYVVVATEPGRSMDMSVSQPYPMRIRYQLDDAPEGTLVRVQSTGDPRGFLRLGSRVIARIARKSLASDLERLRDHLESQRA